MKKQNDNAISGNTLTNISVTKLHWLWLSAAVQRRSADAARHSQPWARDHNASAGQEGGGGHSPHGLHWHRLEDMRSPCCGHAEAPGEGKRRKRRKRRRRAGEDQDVSTGHAGPRAVELFTRGTFLWHTWTMLTGQQTTALLAQRSEKKNKNMPLLVVFNFCHWGAVNAKV